LILINSPNLESCLSSSKVIESTKQFFLKKKQWLLKNQTHGSIIRTTFNFKIRIQYKKDQRFQVQLKQEKDTINLQEKQLKQRQDNLIEEFLS